MAYVILWNAPNVVKKRNFGFSTELARTWLSLCTKTVAAGHLQDRTELSAGSCVSHVLGLSAAVLSGVHLSELKFPEGVAGA